MQSGRSGEFRRSEERTWGVLSRLRRSLARVDDKRGCVVRSATGKKKREWGGDGHRWDIRLGPLLVVELDIGFGGREKRDERALLFGGSAK